MMKILVIDDSKESLALAKAKLAVEGFKVICADSGKAGLEYASIEKPDLILLDVDMPGMSGFDVCRALKGNSELCRIPIIFLSGSDCPKDKVEGLKLGAMDYVTKPFDILELRARVNAALSHTEMAQMFASIPSILISISKDGRVLRWNAGAEKMLNRRSDQVIGKLIGECEVGWEWKEMAAAIAACAERGKPESLDEVRFSRANGKEGVLAFTFNPILAENRRPKGILIFGTDISEQKLMENQLAQAQKLESIGQLAAGIAHEINTPTQFVGDNTRFLSDGFQDLLSLMKKYKELLNATSDGRSDQELAREIRSLAEEIDVEYLQEEIPQAIRQSLDGIERVAKIVRAMKDFSHPGAKEKTTIDINKAITSTITVARNEWKYVAELETVFDQELPPVPCLPGEFNQVILNMITNAAHAIGKAVGDTDEGKGVITIRTHADGDHVEIRISDTGTGIPEEIRAKIFDPFFTTKEVGRGTGQGLAICHDVIIKKHGGSLHCETEVGKGTTFVIRLPLEAATAEIAAEAPGDENTWSEEDESCLLTTSPVS